MIAKTVTYTDYEGNERTETLYFHLSQTELALMQSSEAGGFDKVLRKMIETQDESKLIPMFRDIILKSYGEKSNDGRRFVKSEELSEEFSQTAAFDQLFMELATNTDEMVKFVNGLLPKDLAARVAKNPEVANLMPLA